LLAGTGDLVVESVPVVVSMPAEVTELIHRWRAEAARWTEMAATSGSHEMRIRREYRAEVYESCAEQLADLSREDAE
jgi:hypothetical protein